MVDVINNVMKCFVDDSGKDRREPAFILAAWCGTADAMETFADAWDIASRKDKAIEYFKHSESMALEGCFKDFTATEAEDKRISLAEVIANHPVYGFVFIVPHSEYKTHVTDKAIRKRNRLVKRLADPFYLAFGDLVRVVLSTHYYAGIRDQIDFIFDGNKSDSALGSSVTAYNRLKREFKNHPWWHLMGTIVPGDDKQLLPLQAADLLAGKTRKSVIDDRLDPVFEIWRDRVPILFHVLTQADFEAHVAGFNIGEATNVLEEIKQKRDAE